jgi:hypothetical protein
MDASRPFAKIRLGEVAFPQHWSRPIAQQARSDSYRRSWGFRRYCGRGHFGESSGYSSDHQHKQFDGARIRAFRLFTGPDKASHLLEGTINQSDRTDVIAIHFSDTPTAA